MSSNERDMAAEFDAGRTLFMPEPCDGCGQFRDTAKQLRAAQQRIRGLWGAYQDLRKRHRRALARLGEAAHDAQTDFLESFDPPIDEEPT